MTTNITHSEELHRRHITGAGTIVVRINRQAQLSPDLQHVVARDLNGIILEVGVNTQVRLTVDNAAWLRDTLARAVVEAQDGEYGEPEQPLRVWEKELARGKEAA